MSSSRTLFSNTVLLVKFPKSSGVIFRVLTEFWDNGVTRELDRAVVNVPTLGRKYPKLRDGIQTTYQAAGHQPALVSVE